MFKPEMVKIKIHLQLEKLAQPVCLLSALSQWKPSEAFEFAWTPSGYVLEFEMLQGQILECRIGQGELEEVGPEGLKRFPRAIAAHQDQVLHWEVLGFLTSLDPEHTRSGHIEEHTLFSPELDAEVKLLVYLPPQHFTEPDRVFPVVYLHDGHNVFDRATSSFGFEWQADETAEHFARASQPVVLVGIWTPAEKRNQYYVPFQSRLHNGQEQGTAYVRFIATTLKTHIQQHFPVSPEVSQTAICGSSLGGLISMYATLHHPEAFGVAGLMSPALWVGEYLAFEEVQKLPSAVRYFIDMGDLETDTLEGAALLVRQAKQLALLVSQQGCDIELLIGQGHLHHESAWAERFPAFLKFFLQV
jgi:predicted alpha/beta superfamily hydrolase